MAENQNQQTRPYQLQGDGHGYKPVLVPNSEPGVLTKKQQKRRKKKQATAAVSSAETFGITASTGAIPKTREPYYSIRDGCVVEVSPPTSDLETPDPPKKQQKRRKKKKMTATASSAGASGVTASTGAIPKVREPYYSIRDGCVVEVSPPTSELEEEVVPIPKPRRRRSKAPVYVEEALSTEEPDFEAGSSDDWVPEERENKPKPAQVSNKPATVPTGNDGTAQAAAPATENKRPSTFEMKYSRAGGRPYPGVKDFPVDIFRPSKSRADFARLTTMDIKSMTDEQIARELVTLRKSREECRKEGNGLQKLLETIVLPGEEEEAQSDSEVDENYLAWEKEMRDLMSEMNPLRPVRKPTVEQVTKLSKLLKEKPERHGKTQAQPAGKSGKLQPQPADKGGKIQPQPADKGGKIQPQPADKGGKIQPQPADKGGKTQPQPADKGGKIQPQPADKGGKIQPQPADKGGKKQTQPADKGGKIQPQPADKGGKKQTQPADKGGKIQPQSADQGGKTKSQVADKGGKTQSRRSGKESKTWDESVKNFDEEWDDILKDFGLDDLTLDSEDDDASSIDSAADYEKYLNPTKPLDRIALAFAQLLNDAEKSSDKDAHEFVKDFEALSREAGVSPSLSKEGGVSSSSVGGKKSTRTVRPGCKSNKMRDQPYKCPHCDYSTNHTGNLKNHMTTHLPSQQKPHKCEYKQCEYAAVTKQQLIYHLHKQHGHSDHALTCCQCHYTTTNIGNLKSHMATHLQSQQKPYKCEYKQCEYAAAQKQQLIYHLHKQHGHTDHALTCCHCHYTTTDTGHLKRHMATHCKQT